MVALEKLTPKQFEALQIAEREKEGIWGYKLMSKYGWQLSTAWGVLKQLEKFGCLQKAWEGKHGKNVYSLAPYLHVITRHEKPVDLSIKTMNCEEASQASFVFKFVAAAPGTALIWGSQSWH